MSKEKKQTVESGSGYQISRSIVELSTKTIYEIEKEFCTYALGDLLEPLWKEFGLECTKAFTDVDFQEARNLTAKTTRRSGNTRESKVLKKSGRTDFYTSSLVRKAIHENINIYNTLCAIYGTIKLAYIRGLNPLIIKSTGSDDSEPTLDCLMFDSLRPPGSSINPFHYVNIFCIDSPSEKDNEINEFGQISLLENFDRHFETLMNICAPGKDLDVGKQRKGTRETSLKHFDLVKINSRLNKLHKQSKSSELFRPLQWVEVILKPGDMLTFDCRIPYLFHKNNRNVPSIYTMVSLEPVNEAWYGSTEHEKLKASVNTGMVGDWSTTIVKNTNHDEYLWRSKRTDIYSNYSIVDKTKWGEHQRRIYGELTY